MVNYYIDPFYVLCGSICLCGSILTFTINVLKNGPGNFLMRVIYNLACILYVHVYCMYMYIVCICISMCMYSACTCACTSTCTCACTRTCTCTCRKIVESDLQTPPPPPFDFVPLLFIFFSI